MSILEGNKCYGEKKTQYGKGVPTEVAILNKMVKVDLIRKVTFESGVQVVGHVITRGRVF